ncbi:putative toxin-antitoxin system toxin component, PIN family [Mucilaginibacter corticis]|uniref:Putative toxin-antitoxin system toxin component, PIN family n=1 Tax=Mucilaginibacter corticis TaxID=2597670 RepID=A0A556MFE3_9SPHI|nr:putative toxin-antitoxin system toxin component, PIN family [Mucilaginibacter corticis]TSJ38651.1 putative toxin-antitoxin system toxin component, PIN family [Mucilaginibacter corticis]
MRSSKKLTVVIDTNVLLVSISSRSKYHWLYQALLKGKFSMAISQDILLEYEEIIGKQWSKEVAVNVLRSLSELPNVVFVPIFYKLGLITTDNDDNKFVDCAFAANADYIITHDHHFDVLQSVPFPRIPLANIHQFEQILKF